MRREAKFVQSHAPYAVDLNSLHTTTCYREKDGTPYWSATINAMWFRRRKGVTVACIGHLWDFQHVEPKDAEQFLRQHEDGRYGASCSGRWDGSGYWGAEVPAVIEAHLTLLRPMLENHPAVPPGYDGWWTFR